MSAREGLHRRRTTGLHSDARRKRRQEGRAGGSWPLRRWQICRFWLSTSALVSSTFERLPCRTVVMHRACSDSVWNDGLRRSRSRLTTVVDDAVTCPTRARECVRRQFSWKLPDDLVNAGHSCAETLGVSRAGYVRRAIARMNDEIARAKRARNLISASKSCVRRVRASTPSSMPLKRMSKRRRGEIWLANLIRSQPRSDANRSRPRKIGVGSPPSWSFDAACGRVFRNGLQFLASAQPSSEALATR